MNFKKYELPLLIAITLLSNAVFVLYFLPDLSVLFKYWDGPNYMYVAKTLYNIPANHPFTAYKTTPEYFACHLPFYPLVIRFFAMVASYPMAMILATWASWLAFVISFYYLLKETKWVASPFWTCLIALFFPVRILIYREVGATEPLFLALTMLTALCVVKERWWWGCVFAGLAACTRITGVLLCPALGLYVILQWQLWQQPMEKLKRHGYKILPILMIPLALIGVFTFYYYQYGDFFAYWSWNQRILSKWPFEIFSYFAGAGETRSAELYLLMYAFYTLGVLQLARQKLWLPFSISIMTLALNFFVFHEDLSRYFLVIAPFAILIAYDSIFQRKEFRWVFVLGIIPLAYVYSWKLLPTNLIDGGVFQGLLERL